MWSDKGMIFVLTERGTDWAAIASLAVSLVALGGVWFTYRSFVRDKPRAHIHIERITYGITETGTAIAKFRITHIGDTPLHATQVHVWGLSDFSSEQHPHILARARFERGDPPFEFSLLADPDHITGTSWVGLIWKFGQADEPVEQAHRVVLFATGRERQWLREQTYCRLPLPVPYVGRRKWRRDIRRYVLRFHRLGYWRDSHLLDKDHLGVPKNPSMLPPRFPRIDGGMRSRWRYWRAILTRRR